MRIIPAIDLLNGKCVRLQMGAYSQRKIYNENPLEVAKQFEAFGIQYLHLVDLDGAKSGQIVHHKMLEQFASQTTLQVDFGGGIKRDEDIQMAFDCGASQITVGSIAVKNREKTLTWLENYGAEKIILGADTRNGKIAISGWQADSNEDVLEFIQDYESCGMTSVISTDIAKDGMLSGPSFSLYQGLVGGTNMNVIASGGITTLADLAALKTIGCEGAIIGKAIYEGSITLKELAELC